MDQLVRICTQVRDLEAPCFYSAQFCLLCGQCELKRWMEDILLPYSVCNLFQIKKWIKTLGSNVRTWSCWCWPAQGKQLRVPLRFALKSTNSRPVYFLCRISVSYRNMGLGYTRVKKTMGHNIWILSANLIDLFGKHLEDSHVYVISKFSSSKLANTIAEFGSPHCTVFFYTECIVF